MKETKEIAAAADPALTGRRSALVALADRLGVNADQLFLASLRQVAFKAPNATNEQLLALCVVANQYGLNPFTRELFAFPDRGGGVVPIVSVDGWARIMNDHPQLDGMEFNEAEEWCECVIYRKDRTRPLRAREYMVECQRDTPTWKSHPRRMLRHKAMIQAARLAFGFAGIYDPDEGERIIETQAVVAPVPVLATSSRTEQVKAALGAVPEAPPVPEAVDDVPMYDEPTAIAALNKTTTRADLVVVWGGIYADYSGKVPLPVEARFVELREGYDQ